MIDMWSDVRRVVLDTVTYYHPDTNYEERVMIAEEAARTVVEDVKRFLEKG